MSELAYHLANGETNLETLLYRAPYHNNRPLSQLRPSYQYQRISPRDPRSRGVFAAAIVDPEFSANVYAETVIPPEVRERRSSLESEKSLRFPRSYSLSIYDPDISVVLALEYGLQARTPIGISFRFPKAVLFDATHSALDRQRAGKISGDPDHTDLIFIWKKVTFSTSQRWRLYFVGTVLSNRTSGRLTGSGEAGEQTGISPNIKDSDLLCAEFEGLERIQLFDGFKSLEVDDRKGFEIALIFSAILIRDTIAKPVLDPFNLQLGINAQTSNPVQWIDTSNLPPPPPLPSQSQREEKRKEERRKEEKPTRVNSVPITTSNSDKKGQKPKPELSIITNPTPALDANPPKDLHSKKSKLLKPQLRTRHSFVPSQFTPPPPPPFPPRPNANHHGRSVSLATTFPHPPDRPASTISMHSFSGNYGPDPHLGQRMKQPTPVQIPSQMPMRMPNAVPARYPVIPARQPQGSTQAPPPAFVVPPPPPRNRPPFHPVGPSYTPGTIPQYVAGQTAPQFAPPPRVEAENTGGNRMFGRFMKHPVNVGILKRFESVVNLGDKK